MKHVHVQIFSVVGIALTTALATSVHAQVVPTSPRPLEFDDEVSCGGMDGLQFEVVAGPAFGAGLARIFRNGQMLDAILVKEYYPTGTGKASFIEGARDHMRTLTMQIPGNDGSYSYRLEWGDLFSQGKLNCVWRTVTTQPYKPPHCNHMCVTLEEQ